MRLDEIIYSGIRSAQCSSLKKKSDRRAHVMRGAVRDLPLSKEVTTMAKKKVKKKAPKKSAKKKGSKKKKR